MQIGAVQGVWLADPEKGNDAVRRSKVLDRIDERLFGRSRDSVQHELKKFNVFARKYFFPLCSDYPCYQNLPSARPAGLPIARRAVSEVLCLPFYGVLPLDAVSSICDIVMSLQGCPA